MLIETRAVLAASYLGPNKRNVLRAGGRMLTHAINTETDQPLCDRVSALSLADRYADDPDKPPTCPTCRRRDPRFPRSANRQPLTGDNAVFSERQGE